MVFLATGVHRFATELDLDDITIMPQDLCPSQGRDVLSVLAEIVTLSLMNLHKHLLP